MSLSSTENSTQPSNQQAANDLRAAAGEQARDLAQTAEEKAKLLKESATEKAKEFRDATAEKTSSFRHTAEGQLQEVQAKLREYHSETEEYVRKNPTKGILVAAAVGFVAGLVIRR